MIHLGEPGKTESVHQEMAFVGTHPELLRVQKGLRTGVPIKSTLGTVGKYKGPGQAPGKSRDN